MAQFHALKRLPQSPKFTDQDVLVIFGELFDRGYANGLVAAATSQGMRVIEGTVGRRDKDSQLRPLSQEELSEKSHHVINVPLEAGFDLHQDAKGHTPCDQLQGIKLGGWQDIKLDFAAIERARGEARQDFRSRVQKFFEHLAAELGSKFSGRLLLAHTMAGGVPRAKIIMPLMNRVFKGTGERYLSSKEFWESEIGQFCAMSFDEVTADTLDVLIEETTKLRNSIEQQGGEVAYLAYGYHGTEVLIQNEMRWQTYTPYLQGWSKIRLEQHAKKHSQTGINVSVFNCPEILTNSSSIFQGVEVSLYPLVGALRKLGADNERTRKLLQACRDRLQENVSFSQLLEFTDSYLTDRRILETCKFDQWPQHSTQEQLEFMLASSEKLRGMHKDSKQLMTEVLSEGVFLGTGELMLAAALDPESPVTWLGHDIIVEQLARS